ncbi:two-component system, OmpR family, alkaline phosphatase synthesis response regulator PhoP [Hymenobacter actinosclerus]|uniref:Phosphate regulon transcriptional regulatory protein PhoB n=1 Tax=Hymenobacter actinosclerus TaxID=82805 RepID=A0A1I0H7V9_9BACT|nr:two-component system, OmpR family, alkaline phosphatase synthesis response regulator PhoP [Hymenobacter actinosclerus]
MLLTAAARCRPVLMMTAPAAASGRPAGLADFVWPIPNPVPAKLPRPALVGWRRSAGNETITRRSRRPAVLLSARLLFYPKPPLPVQPAPTANPNAYKILVVDDDPDIVELLEYNLRKEGYAVASAADGRQALDVAQQFGPDIVLLDVMMPKLDGIAACRQLRELPRFKDTYIIFLTARAEEFSEVAAFDAGADDFIAKPIKPRALLSRLAAYVRRDKEPQHVSDTIEINGLTIDRTGFAVYQDGRKITLPKKEFELLAFLAASPHKVFGREELLQNIWGNDVFVLARTVDVHVRKVREKVGDHHIQTIKGVGYKFNSD